MHFDPELQLTLAKQAFAGLVHLLAIVPRGEEIEAEGIGAMLRLIDQACHADHVDGERDEP